MSSALVIEFADKFRDQSDVGDTNVLVIWKGWSLLWLAAMRLTPKFKNRDSLNFNLLQLYFWRVGVDPDFEYTYYRAGRIRNAEY